jgi:2-polyprenyl-3-methyl-5-hydroxy-6-metoxy-1,4-benzoquinol methylase
VSLQALPRRVVGRSRRALGRLRRRGRPRAPGPPRHATQSERKLRARITSQGGRLDPTRPIPIWRSWVNASLKTREQVDAARKALVDAGLSPHPDDPKNWDALIALGLVLDRFGPRARVLDAGATQYSRLLPWLYLYGFRRLHGIDLTYEGEFQVGPIRYARMDLTRTSFRSGWFDVIACLSVIEHGVPVDEFLRESARLLRPGGLLITSTDFWAEGVETTGLEAYGAPVKIFTAPEIAAWVEAGQEHGLRPFGPLDLACENRVVHWERVGLDFTFVNFVLERRRGGLRDRIRAFVRR